MQRYEKSFLLIASFDLNVKRIPVLFEDVLYIQHKIIYMIFEEARSERAKETAVQNAHVTG